MILLYLQMSGLAVNANLLLVGAKVWGYVTCAICAGRGDSGELALRKGAQALLKLRTDLRRPHPSHRPFRLCQHRRVRERLDTSCVRRVFRLTGRSTCHILPQTGHLSWFHNLTDRGYMLSLN